MLAEVFARTARDDRAAFIPFLVAGDPTPAISRRMLSALVALGADIIELGVPFSDPIADGPTIAAAAQRALANKVGIADVLELASTIRSVPIVVFTYYNPLLQFGIEKFARDAAAAGIAAVIVVDLADESSGDADEIFRAYGIARPLFVAPTTTVARFASIAAKATGFVYVVSRLGVTGGDRGLEIAKLAMRVACLREVTSLPLIAGFGIASAPDISEIAQFADGIVVGSALIEAYAASPADPVEALVGFVTPLVASTARMSGPRSEAS